jgi:hypothetical protein
MNAALRFIVAGLLAGATVSCRGVGSPAASPPQTPANGVLAPAGARGGESSRPRFDSERLWGSPGRDDWEPVVAADPSSRWVYQITTRQHPNFLLFRASADGGTTWSQARHICRRGVRRRFQFDPQIAVAPDGTVDAVCLDNWVPGVVFTQSHDHGRTWSAPVRLDGNRHYSDKPILIVSRSGSDAYVAFNIYDALYVAASHDGGATWAPAVKATDRRLWYYPSSGTVAPDGSAWFAVDGETGKNQTGAGRIALVRSTDGGANWTTIPMASTHEGAPCRVNNCYPDFFTGQAAVAAGTSGAFAVAYAQNRVRQGPNALFVRYSSDGRRWSAPVTIADAGNSTSPAIVAGPKPGDFRLVWQDDRNGPQAWNTWYARSRDGGATWTAAVRLSDRGAGAPYKHRDGYDFPFGDYLGLGVDAGGTNYVIWGEGSAVYVPGGTWWTRGGSGGG